MITRDTMRKTRCAKTGMSFFTQQIPRDRENYSACNCSSVRMFRNRREITGVAKVEGNRKSNVQSVGVRMTLQNRMPAYHAKKPRPTRTWYHAEIAKRKSVSTDDRCQLLSLHANEWAVMRTSSLPRPFEGPWAARLPPVPSTTRD
jgi:hypothetical protein